MEEGEVVLSDVHINIQNETLKSKNFYISRFYFRSPDNGDSKTKQEEELYQLETNRTCGTTRERLQEDYVKSCIDEDDDQEGKSNDDDCLTSQYDEDGDLVLTRKKRRIDDEEDENNDNMSVRQRKKKKFDKKHTHVINIVHRLATELKHVGEQVWNGALLMSDYIIHDQSNFKDKVVLDLGAGTGLTSVVAAFFAKRVICTDKGHSILKLAQHNMEQNYDVLDLNKPQNFCVEELDWFSEDLSGKDGTGEAAQLSKEIKDTDIIIAADVIYDDDITDAFFRTVYKIMSCRPSKVLYVSLEKRYVFTVDDKDVVCPAFHRFRECLDDLHLCNEENGVQFKHEEIPVHFPKFFEYNRTKELVMWKISSVFPTT